MRLLLFFLYMVQNSLLLASNHVATLEYENHQAQVLTQVFSNEPFRELFFNKELSKNEKINLNLFFHSIPSNLLKSSFISDIGEVRKYNKIYFSKSSENIKTTSHRKILHYLLYQYDRNTDVSDSRQWKNFSGWKRAWHGLKMSANNRDARAYADEYGMNNPRDDFIATAEHYILPPTSTLERSIKCRTPLKYNFVKALFIDYVSPLEREFLLCRDKSDGLLDDVVFVDPDSGDIIELGPVNENTVTGFELMYATPGTGDASEIAGHLLLRIKLNNNLQADALGIENPKDLVISFLANTSEKQSAPQVKENSTVKAECKKNWFDSNYSGQSNFAALHAILQSLKGLSGGFLTLMDRQPLSQALKNYTIEEDRDLLRYKLVLNSIQKKRLLEQLYRAKKNYNAKYFFFNQNCASVLVKVIGIGIESSKIAEFNPIVSPPNSLVGLFIREGLATPIRPAFYSYRKKAFLAQDLIASYYKKIRIDYSKLLWTAISPLFVPNPKNRLAVLKAIANNIGVQEKLDNRLNYLFVLVQEAEMAYEHKDLVCEQYTSIVTDQARQYQRGLILTSKSTPIIPEISTDQLLDEQYIGTANAAFEQGVPHTKLLSYALGVGQYKNNQQVSRTILSLNLSLDEQQLGSISNIAMQRSSYVKLASIHIDFAKATEQQDNIQSWRFTALDVRKFKERLNRVPSYFSSAGSIGLGLSLFDIEKDNDLDIVHGSWFGGELLFNLLSSAEHNDYVYTSIGADLRYHKNYNSTITRVALPIRVETLWTFDNNRRWQWRNDFEFRYSTDIELDHEFEFSTGLTYQVGEIGGQLILIRLSSEYKKLSSSFNSQTTWMAVEINPY